VREVNGTKSFLHRDHLASIRFITNPAETSGRTTSYTPFGEPTKIIKAELI